jgi:hypothetical protein
MGSENIYGHFDAEFFMGSVNIHGAFSMLIFFIFVTWQS